MECTRCRELLIESARELCWRCLGEGEAMEADECDSGCSFMETWGEILFSDMLLKKCGVDVWPRLQTGVREGTASAAMSKGRWKTEIAEGGQTCDLRQKVG
jgi:hypothetical protein